VNLVNAPYNFPVADQEATLAAIEHAGVHVIRCAIPADDKGIDFAQRVYAHGIKIEWIVDIKAAPGTPWPQAPEGFKGLWLGYPLSKADPDRFRTYFEPLLAKLEEKKIVLVAFELGNEINWAGFNADFVLPSTGRVLGKNDLTNDPEGKEVAQGFVQYVKLLAVLKDVRDHSKLNQKTPVISAGLYGPEGSTWPQTRRADAVSVSATLDFLRAQGLDKLVDGYGIHNYPPSTEPGTSAGAAKRRLRTEQNGLQECQPPQSAVGKPCWFTEWGVGGVTDACPVDDTTRMTLVREMRGYYSQLAQQGRLHAVFFYTWQGNPKAPKEEPASAFRCGALTKSGELAIAP
jgi:hypothetical protein